MIKKITDLLKKYEELIRYCIVGALTTLFSMAFFYASVWTFLDGNDPFQLQIANVISWIAGVSFAYVTNRKYVFMSKNEKIFEELVKFVGSRVVTLLQDMLLMFVLVTLHAVNYNFAKIVSTALVIILNYILSKLFVFKKDKASDEKKDR